MYFALFIVKRVNVASVYCISSLCVVLIWRLPGCFLFWSIAISLCVIPEMYLNAVLYWQHNVHTLGFCLCFDGCLDKLGFHISLKACPLLLNVCRVTIICLPVFMYFFSLVDHLPDKETRKRKPKKTFEIDFSDDVNFDTYFRSTRVRTLEY